MGAPKQKWTAEEEQALRAGVEKYGPGKWRAIQKDPKYGPYLTQRSNVDLKDKWRNMSVAAGSTSVTPKEKPSREARAAASAAREAIREAETDEDAGLLSKTKPVSTQQYDDMVINAIDDLKEKAGSSVVSILKHAEEHNAVPANFKRILTNRIKLLVDDGKIVKVKQNFKLSEATAAALAPSAAPSRSSKRHRTEAEDSKKMVVYAGREATRLPSGVTKLRKEVIASKKAKVEADHAKMKMKTAEEAARQAALAVAEAEEAAAAAEEAARDAEQAEAEAEQAEAAAEAAAAAVKPPKKRSTSAAGKTKP